MGGFQTMQARTALCGISGGPTTNAFRPYYGIRIFKCSLCNLGDDAGQCGATTDSPTVPEPDPFYVAICPTGYSPYLPPGNAVLHSIPSDEIICTIDPICGYGQPYNKTSKQCTVPGVTVSTDPNVAVCPRGSAFDTYLGYCIYIGDLQTPTTISAAALQCPAERTPVLTGVPFGPRYTCVGPPTIAPPSAVITDGQIISVQGIPTFNSPVPAIPSTVSQGCITIFDDNDNIYTQKSIGSSVRTCQSGDVPSSLNPIFGTIDTNLTGANGTDSPVIYTIPYSPPSTSMDSTLDVIDCSFIYNQTLVALADPATVSSCITFLQFGCPTIQQLMVLQGINGTDSTGGGPSTPPCPGGTPSPSMPGGTGGSPSPSMPGSTTGSPSPSMPGGAVGNPGPEVSPAANAVGDIVAKTANIVNRTKSTLNSVLFGGAP